MTLKDFHYFMAGNGHGGAGRDSSAPWIIFLHGLLGSSANWRRIVPSFEDQYRVLYFDQRGHGKSLRPATGYAPEDFAGDLLFLMDQLKIERADLVGHSMGGRNAFCFANLHPDRVRKLVIEDIGPETSTVNGRDLIERLEKVPVPFANKKDAKEYLLNDFNDPRLGNFLYTNIGVAESGRAVWSFDMKNIIEIISRGRDTVRWSEIRNLKCPTLVIRGELSDELSHDEFEKMKACNTNVLGVEISGTGHWVHFEKPDEFIDVVKKFLES